MKSILFIVPTNTSGGTNSSLSSFVNHLKDEYKIKILVLNPHEIPSYGFLKNTLSSIYLQAYYGTYSEFSIKVKLFSFLIKILKRVSILCSFDIESYICKIAAHRLETKYQFDAVVGFQEGLSMKVASYFTCSNKVSWLHCDYSRIVDANDLKYYRKFNCIVAVSKYTLNSFLNCFPELKSKTTFLYNFLDSQRISSLSQLPIDDERFNNCVFTILSVGRMDPVKQFSLIPQIADSMITKGVKFRWYIIGGPENVEFRKVQHEIEKYHLTDVVMLLGAKTNPYPYFKASNIFVSISKSEACPMVFTEARLCGIPVVSSDFGSAYEFIQDGIDGFIRPIGDIGELLTRLISDENLYRKIRNNSSHNGIASSEFDKQKLRSILG